MTCIPADQWRRSRPLAPDRITLALDPVSYPPKSSASAVPQSKSAQAAALVAAANGRVITYSPLPSQVTTRPIPSTAAPFAWPSTNAKASGSKSGAEGSFQVETRLHRLGYRITGLSRSHRWNILIPKALPTMPLQGIAPTIAMNVRLRKLQTNGPAKYAHAIAEWEHDLKRLKQEYYKSTFSWPNY